jgi:ribosomal-protein-alanine N-acetyltransferase
MLVDRYRLRLVSTRDAQVIALMSRQLIEAGLPRWSWTPRRLLRDLRHPDTTGVVAECDRRLVAFGLMRVHDSSAHMNLLAVGRRHRRRGLGSQIVCWLEETALTAGVTWMFLETRITNTGARRFYEAHSYGEIERVPGYYCGCEAAVRMARDLRRIDVASEPTTFDLSRFR